MTASIFPEESMSGLLVEGVKLEVDGEEIRRVDVWVTMSVSVGLET